MRIESANDRDYSDGPIKCYNAHIIGKEDSITQFVCFLEDCDIAYNVGIAPEDNDNGTYMVTVFIFADEYSYKSDWIKAIRKAKKAWKNTTNNERSEKVMPAETITESSRYSVRKDQDVYVFELTLRNGKVIKAMSHTMERLRERLWDLMSNYETAFRVVELVRGIDSEEYMEVYETYGLLDCAQWAIYCQDTHGTDSISELCD